MTEMEVVECMKISTNDNFDLTTALATLIVLIDAIMSDIVQNTTKICEKEYIDKIVEVQNRLEAGSKMNSLWNQCVVGVVNVLCD